MANALAITLANNNSAREESKRLGAEISELCSYIYAAEHRLLTLIREFDEQKGWQWLGFHSCACWLNFKCSIDMNTARERVRVALALGKLPKIDARFATGALSYSKMRAMTRIADESNEDYLLMIAKHGTAYHVEKLVSKYRRVLRLRDAAAACTAYDNRQLSYRYDCDGCLVIKGRFPAEQGALIVKALEMAMEKDFVGAPHGRDRGVLLSTPAPFDWHNVLIGRPALRIRSFKFGHKIDQRVDSVFSNRIVNRCAHATNRTMSLEVS